MTQTINEIILALADDWDGNCTDLAALFTEYHNAHEAEVCEDGNIRFTLSRSDYGWEYATDDQLTDFVEWVNS